MSDQLVYKEKRREKLVQSDRQCVTVIKLIVHG